MPTCHNCGQDKPDTEFSWKIRTQNLRQTVCRACANAYAATYRKDNTEKVLQKNHRYYHENREALLAQKREYGIANRDTLREKHKQHYQANRAHILAQSKERSLSLKLQAFAAYGGVYCQCCGETEVCFLTIDHIHGKTAAQKKKEGEGSSFYQWLKRNQYPAGYQTLCFNCNLGRGFNGGICPHHLSAEDHPPPLPPPPQ